LSAIVSTPVILFRAGGLSGRIGWARVLASHDDFRGRDRGDHVVAPARRLQ